MRIPKRGSDLCITHGQNLPNVKAKAATRRAAEHFDTFGKPRPHNLGEGILEEIYWAKGHLDFLRDQIKELDPEDVTWGLTEHSDKTGGEDWGIRNVEKAGVNVWVKLYQDQQKLYMDLVKTAHGMGIEERRIKLAEQYGNSLLRFAQIFAEQYLGVLANLGWDRDELEEVREQAYQKATPLALTALKEEAGG